MNGLKVRDSKIQGKGLFADKEFNEGDIIGIAHINDKPTGMIGRFHNHSDSPNAHSVSIGNKRYLAALRPLRKGEEITVDYRRQPELEQPEEFENNKAIKYQNGGEKTCEDGRCLETDQAQELLDKADALRYKNVGLMWDVADKVNPEGRHPGNAAAVWKQHGAGSLANRLGMENPPNCMWAAGSGYQCLPETKGKIPLQPFESNDKFISAVSKGSTPFRRVAVTQDPNFANQDTNMLRTGDIINMKGPKTSHAMTFSHYREDGVPIFLDSNGEASDFSWNQGLIPGMIPGKNGVKAYVSRLDNEALYKKEINALEEKARTNPTYLNNQSASLNIKQDGGEPKNRKLRLRQEDYDPTNEAGYIQETPEVTALDPTIWGKYGRKYEENVSEEDFINRKKKQYLALHPGLTKTAGLTMDNFPTDVEQNFRDAYDYNKHTAMVKGVSKEEGWNPKKRDTYVDDLNAQGTRIISDSKYGSKLKPSTWSRSLAGLQELGNTLVPGQPFKYNIPGLTKKEQKEMRDSKLSALEVFAPANTIGQNIANAAKNTGLSYGSDYKELPGALSGEFMPNVDDTDAMGLDPIQMVLGIYSGAQLPALLTKLPGQLVKGTKSAVNTAKEVYDAGRDIKGIYNAGKGSNLAFTTASEAQAAKALQEAGLLSKNIDPKLLGRYPGLGQSVTRQALKNYNTSYRAVTPEIANASIDELMNMSKSGITNFDDPAQIAQYMSTHIPLESYGYRANAMQPGVGQEMLYTGKYPNIETAAEKLKKYGTHLTEVRPPMDFSKGNAKDWFDTYYTDKPFGLDNKTMFKNEGDWLTGYKPGTIAARREFEYWPYIGNKGEKVLEPIRTVKLKGL